MTNTRGRTSKDTLTDLINEYEAYINLLCDELSGLVGLAAVHGWRSDKYELGLRRRRRIRYLRRKCIKANGLSPDAIVPCGVPAKEKK